MLREIWSGGQTGVDRAALDAALETDYQTGGWMPLGFIAKDGKHPEFAFLYGMREHTSSKYPPRTACNVRDTDGTLCIAADWDSAGEVLTKKMIKQYNKPSLAITIWTPEANYELISDWIASNGISRLNVAGNREESAPGIYNSALSLLVRVLRHTRTRESQQPPQLGADTE